MIEWLLSLGYLGAFIGVILEGEILLLSVLQTANLGYTNLYGIIVAAFLGTLLGDWFFFLTGRRRGRAFLENRPKLQAKFQKANRMVEKNSTWLLLSYRFIYGFRVILPLSFGISAIPLRKFAIFSLISTILWLSMILYFNHFLASLFQIEAAQI